MTDQPQDQPGPAPRLDEIQTRWSLLRLAHQNTPTTAGAARNDLVLRYAGAIRKYLGLLIPDEQDADEVSQEMVVRLLRGDFARATPERGRFRDYLAVAARNLARGYQARRWRRKDRERDMEQFADAAHEPAGDADWVATWRQSVLEKAWAALEEYQRTHRGSVSWTLLRLRTAHPDDDAEQLAGRLTEAVGRPFRVAALRQQLHRARLRFAQFLLEEVARGLDDPTPERVEEELVDIGLIEYVRDLLPADWRTRGELDGL